MANMKAINEYAETAEGYADDADSHLSDARYALDSVSDFDDVGIYLGNYDLTDIDQAKGALDDVNAALGAIDDAKCEVDNAASSLSCAYDQMSEVMDALTELIEAHDEEPDVEVGDTVKIGGDNPDDKTYTVMFLLAYNGKNYALLTPEYEGGVPKVAAVSDLLVE